MVQTSKCFLSHNTLNMNVVFNNTLNITKFYYQFQQQKVYSIKVDKMFNLIFSSYKEMYKFLYFFPQKTAPL